MTYNKKNITFLGFPHLAPRVQAACQVKNVHNKIIRTMDHWIY